MAELEAQLNAEIYKMIELDIWHFCRAVDSKIIKFLFVKMSVYVVFIDVE